MDRIVASPLRFTSWMCLNLRQKPSQFEYAVRDLPLKLSRGAFVYREDCSSAFFMTRPSAFLSSSTCTGLAT